MASTYSTNLALELIGTGDQAGTWGNTTNTNLGTLIEQAISGYVTQAVTTGNTTTITIPNGATGVARNMFIELTGTGGTNTVLQVPANKKLYFVYNNASGAVTVKVSGQTGVSVAAGEKVILVSNGTDVVAATSYVTAINSSLTLTTLTATSANITTLTSTSANITTITGTTLGTFTSGTVTNLNSTSANITTLTGTTFGTTATTQLRGASAQITTATLTSANITTSSITSLGVGTAASGTTGEIRATNNVTAYYSDARLKDFKGNIGNALYKVSQLNGYYFTENAKAEEFGYNNKKLQVGVSAQEVQAVLPEVVAPAPFDVDGNDISKSGENYITVRYEKLVPLLIEAIKELTAKVEALEGKK